MATEQLDSNFIYLALKVGNQAVGSGKLEQSGFKDGMILDIIDPTQWVEDVILSTNMQIINGWIKLPRSWKQTLLNAAMPETTSGKERASVGYIALDELEAATGIVGLESDLRGTGAVSIIDGSALSTSLIKNSQSKEWQDIEDKNAITSGSFTVGSGGQDYATWKLALGDISNMDGDLTITQETAVAEATGANVFSFDLNNNTFKMTSDTSHNGDPTAGHLITHNWSGAQNWINFENSATGGGVIEIEKLTMIHGSVAQSASSRTFQIFSIASCTIRIHDVLANGNSGNSANFIVVADVDPTVELWNIEVWDYGTRAFWLGLIAINSSSITENCTAKNCVIGLDAEGEDSIIRNVACIENSTADFTDVASATIDYCASDDASAPGGNSVTDITPSDEFESLTDTDTNYLKVSEGNLSTAGQTTTISANTVGIRGNAGGRAGSSPSIGADEFAVVGVIRNKVMFKFS